MLEVDHLSVSYGAHRALEDVSIRVAAGEICVILGANGAGKSSLLKTIGGMVPATNGARITIDGKDITRAKPHKVVEAGLALVPEGRGIFGDLTVAENLQLGAYGRQARANEVKRREEVLTLFPRLAERRNQVARTMSGGEQQMVAIGRALMSNPTILMLDEPSLGLSPLLTKDLFRSLKAVRETGVGILLVEQNAKQSLAIADRGYLIENGHITGEGTGVDLARDPAVQAAYLGGAVAAGQKREEIMVRDEHRRFYVPAGAVGGGQTQPETSARPEHGQFYVPLSATGGSDGKAASPNPAESAVRPEHRQFYVPAGAVGGGAQINGQANGHGHKIAETTAQSGDAIIMSSQAHELSLQAAEFVKKATRIQREHVEAQRVAYHLDAATKLVSTEKPAAPAEKAASASASDLGRQAADFAARAERIQREHVAAERAATSAGAKPKKLKGRSKKLAKKAEKLAKKAEKLAAKATHMSE
ncbi:MAG: ABC transporter ATP-binding protein [Oricola sp.]